MHHARALVLACVALAASAACLRTTYPDADRVSVVQTTGAAAESEPPPEIHEVAARFAGEICAREVQCHADPSRAEPCRRTYLSRAHAELASWQCAPAAARARLKECITALRAEPCTLDFATRRTLCEANPKCPDPEAKIVSPGSAHADAGL
jgi:hypothetical protein